MKKLIILLFLMPFALYGQKTQVRTVVSNEEVSFYRGLQLLNVSGLSTDYLPKTDPIVNGLLTTLKLKVGSSGMEIDSIILLSDGTFAVFVGPDTIPPKHLTTEDIDISTIAVMQEDSTTYAGGYASLSDFKGTLTPRTNNTSALGSTSLMYSDLFLGDGSVVNFNNGDVTLNHASNELYMYGGRFNVVYNNAGSQALYVENSSTTDGSVAILGLSDNTSGSGTYTGLLGRAVGSNTGVNVGISATATGGTTNWAGYFTGAVTITTFLQLTPTADPPTAAEGRVYADTDHHLYYYNGTTWVQLDN